MKNRTVWRGPWVGDWESLVLTLGPVINQQWSWADDWSMYPFAKQWGCWSNLGAKGICLVYMDEVAGMLYNIDAKLPGLWSKWNLPCYTAFINPGEQPSKRPSGRGILSRTSNTCTQMWKGLKASFQPHKSYSLATFHPLKETNWLWCPLKFSVISTWKEILSNNRPNNAKKKKCKYKNIKK